MTFYIFRHGETFVTRDRVGYGPNILDAPILEEGKEALLRLAVYLKGIKSDFAVSSEILRCRQTVEIVSKISGKKFEFDSRLNEFSLNELNNETFEVFLSRVQSFMNEVKAKKYDSVLICTHGAVIAVLKHLITTGVVSMEDIPDYPNPGILMIIKDQSVEEISFRD
ncbi:MAG: histidine phosphatase family protein [Candidatus Daviesbacteria bacterium]|nr:histidine phosphatase family protein [Candidatus Daviesbacteria bacterium]